MVFFKTRLLAVKLGRYSVCAKISSRVFLDFAEIFFPVRYPYTILLSLALGFQATFFVGIVVGGIKHETNTFNPKLTRIEDFQIRRDRELLKDEEIKPFIARGIEIIPTLWAEAIPSGPVERETHLYLKADILRHIRACKGIEGVCLHLHGAMEVEEIGDGENDFVKSVRELVGPDVLISVSLDLHGNISPGLLKFADIFTAYRTAPHVDRMETRERALYLLVN